MTAFSDLSYEQQLALIGQDPRLLTSGLLTLMPGSTGGAAEVGQYLNASPENFYGWMGEGDSTSPADVATSGGGGGGGFVAPPRRELASSPEWLAYLNALGLEENQFRADIDRQRGLLRSEADRQVQGLKPQYAKERRGIAGSLESRGMLRSGEYLRRQAESRAGEGRAQSNIQAGLTGQLSNLESSLANKLIDIGGRRAQQELSMRSQGYY